ncbi:unnamed protein product [Litomosoides sigmodontis]|uniref:Uncharacterized protein n=1 Tax=Litomosoides sigmodontis TaxID=42156 RepID=A0A3P6T182_LITSI|nr:unnamed protein product [Litomosoides sigmodontis]
MISEVLGLLLGQIAVLSMQRFFKALPRPWIQKTQVESNCFPTASSICKKMQMRTQIVISSINEALLKLHNYDKQLIRFEETFIGSVIVLLIIFGILLTVLLWLRRLSHMLPNRTSQNNIPLLLDEQERNEPKYDGSKRKETNQEISGPESPTTVTFTSNLEIMRKLKERVDRMKEVAVRNKRRNRAAAFGLPLRHRQKTCKTNLPNCSGNYNGHSPRRTFGEVKRRRYIPILLFLSDEPMDEDVSQPSMEVPQTNVAKLRKRRRNRIS